MPLHPLTRLCACFATGVLIAAVALIAVDRAFALEPALKFAWLWLGGSASIALSTFCPRCCAADPQRRPRAAASRTHHTAPSGPRHSKDIPMSIRTVLAILISDFELLRLTDTVEIRP
ncbi:hypothetical protein BH10PSE8_BH10PSE8_01800 [soil metagenome]